MTPRRLVEYGLTVVALVVSVLGLRVVAAYAQTAGGSIGDTGVGADISVPGGNGSNGTNNSATGGSSSNGTGASVSSGGGAPASTVWTRHFWGGDDPGYMTNAPITCLSGVPYEDVQTDLASGAVLQRVQGCTALPVAGSPVVATTSPPAPPTAAEARSLVALPSPAFGMSPALGGLTGLEVRLWDASDTSPRTAVAVIRGYTVTSTARPIRWAWDMADTGPASASNGPTSIVSSRPGSELSPAGRFTYQTKGEYAVAMTTTWGGSYSYVGNGSAAVTADLGTTTRTARRGYAVAEVRPVLVAR